MVNKIENKNPIYFTDQYDVILLGTNIFGDLVTGGFQAQMRFKYPYLHELAYTQPYGDQRLLGTRITVHEEGDPIISLMYIAGYKNMDNVSLDRDALENCLMTANAEFKGKRIVTTVLGTTPYDGNDNRISCYRLIRKCLTDVDCDIYDYKQKHYKVMCREVKNRLKTKSEILLYNELKKHYLK